MASSPHFFFWTQWRRLTQQIPRVGWWENLQEPQGMIMMIMIIFFFTWLLWWLLYQPHFSESWMMMVIITVWWWWLLLLLHITIIIYMIIMIIIPITFFGELNDDYYYYCMMMIVIVIIYIYTYICTALREQYMVSCRSYLKPMLWTLGEVGSRLVFGIRDFTMPDAVFSGLVVPSGKHSNGKSPIYRSCSH